MKLNAVLAVLEVLVYSNLMLGKRKDSEDSPKPNPSDLLEVMSGLRPIISMLAGIKAQAREEGFSEEAAEQIALMILSKTGN